MPAIVPTYEGSGSALHPSVVDFRTPWNGWRFWMAFTPWPSDAHENPSIVVSQDGFTWQPPAGLTNPIHPWSGVVGEYNSDTELVYDPDGDRLICYWRTVEDVGGVDYARLYARTSTDGVAWGEPTYIGVQGTPVTWLLSPCVIRRGRNDWWMFAIRTAVSGAIHVWQSTDPLSGWGVPTSVSINTAIVEPWHLGMCWDGSRFVGMISKRATDPKCQWGISSSDGYTWTTRADEMTVLLVDDEASWDNSMYRACLSVRDAEWMDVWYSSTAVPTRRIGYTRIPRSAWPDPPPPA